MPRLPSRAAALALAALKSPSRAAQQAGEDLPAAAVYAAFLAGSLLFYWLKPFNFPDVNAAFPRESQSLWFWLKVMAFQPPLEGAWIVFLLGLAGWFGAGSLGLRLVAGVAWTAAPFILMAVYREGGSIGKAGLALGYLACLAAFVPFLRRPGLNWRPVAGFMLAVNAVGLLLLLPMTAAVLVRSTELFKTAQIVGGLWILGAATVGVKQATGLRLPRAFMAVFLSMFFQISFAFALFLLGVVPKEILKALLYA